MSAHRRTPPTTVAWLGYGGLLPFVGLALLAGSDGARAALWSEALIGYGAVILGFVGALHWGFAMSATGLAAGQRRGAYLWSVLPALTGWSALLLAGTAQATVAACLLLVAGFLAQLARDHLLASAAGLPLWYLPMRTRLTGVASLSLLAHAFLRG